MENTEILNEIHKGAKMGMESIGTITEKVEDLNFKKVLTAQYNEYKKIYDNSELLISKNHGKPEDIPPMQNMMTWMGIQMNTLTNTSNNKLADLMIQGINMGIIKGNEILNHEKNMPQEIHQLVDDYVALQERNLDEMKKWL